MRVAVIVNPIAGRGRPSSATGSERRDLVRAWLAAQAVDADVSLTTRGGHAAVLSRQFLAQGFDRIVAWGGDGTANEVAGPLIGSRAVFGLVAAGSGDGLARGLGVPRVPRLALEVAVHGRVVRRDVGRFGSRHFLNVAGIGFDAAVARAFGEHTIGGLRGYLRAGLHLVHSYEAATYELDFDGSRSAGPRFMIAFANGPEYGNGFVLAPGADPADGRLDVVELEGGSAARQLWRARRLLLAPGRPASGIVRRRVQRATVSGTALLAHVDGEVFEPSGPLDVRVDPGAMLMAVPPGPRGGG